MKTASDLILYYQTLRDALETKMEGEDMYLYEIELLAFQVSLCDDFIEKLKEIS